MSFNNIQDQSNVCQQHGSVYRFTGMDGFALINVKMNRREYYKTTKNKVSGVNAKQASMIMQPW